MATEVYLPDCFPPPPLRKYFLFLFALTGMVASAHAEPTLSRVPDPLVFAGSADYPPFQWVDDAGRTRGFLIDLQEAIATQGNTTAQHRLTEWSTAIDAVKTGEADVVAMFRSEERSRYFAFTEPVYYVAHGIFSHVDDGERFSSLEALAGHTVAVVDGAYAEERLSNYGDMNLASTPTELACLELVAARKAAACVEAAHTARRNAADADLDVRQTSPPFWPQPYVFAVRKGRTELLNWLNQQLAIVIANGQFYRIYQTWEPQLEWHEQTIFDVVRNAAWIILPLLLLVGAGYFWSWSLRKQVADKTNHLATELERREQLQEELKYKAEYDALTGLPNRYAFVEHLQSLIESDSSQRHPLIGIRIENLQKLVTTFGYDITDDLVNVFARHLETLDHYLIGYFGWGTYFFVPKRVMEPAEVIDLTTEPLALSSIEIDPTIAASAVIETRTDDDISGRAMELIRCGSLGLLAAQEKGLQAVMYDSSLEPNPDDLLLLQDFRRYGTGNMFLEYQPNVNLHSREIQGAEALVRWKHPTLGLIPPSRFIPLLEESGLINQITYWVFDEVVKLVQSADLDGGMQKISINMAPQDFLQPNILEVIKQAISPIDPACVHVEITETGFIEDPVRVRRVLSELRRCGVSSSVDDFGTGYASLFYLSEFPVDDVKLDRVFVGDMSTNERHRIIVQAAIKLAHELGLSVTAEGVEDIQTLEALIDMGCDQVQGYLISKPVSDDQFLSLLGRNLESLL